MDKGTQKKNNTAIKIIIFLVLAIAAYLVFSFLGYDEPCILGAQFTYIDDDNSTVLLRYFDKKSEALEFYRSAGASHVFLLQEDDGNAKMIFDAVEGLSETIARVTGEYLDSADLEEKRVDFWTDSKGKAIDKWLRFMEIGKLKVIYRIWEENTAPQYIN